jgi:hypothetical protein
MEMKRFESYGFGYDFDAVKDVQDYVINNYDEGDYNIHIAQGDDVMNFMTIHRGVDVELDRLIECCDGEGNFEE